MSYKNISPVQYKDEGRKEEGGAQCLQEVLLQRGPIAAYLGASPSLNYKPEPALNLNPSNPLIGNLD